jgi:hypothetical protein
VTARAADLHVRSTDPNPGGSTGTPGLAFLDFAEMAAYPVGALTKGNAAEVLSTGDVWTYDPTSTLVPDVTATAPLGQTVVAANGVGNWLRSNPYVLRWAGQGSWVVDPIAGSVEGSGSALDPIDSVSEFLRRTTSLLAVSIAVAPLGYDVLILSDCQTTEEIAIDGRMETGVVCYVFRADPIPIASFAVTAQVDAAPATQTLPTITCAGLPVSFTASGIVGTLGIVTAGANVGTEFWVMRDEGAGTKTATITQPQANIFDETPGFVDVGDTITFYSLVRLGSLVSVLQTGGAGAQTDFWNLQVADPALPHSFEAKAGAAVLANGCELGGGDVFGGAIGIAAFNCKAHSPRAETSGVYLLANGYTLTGGVTGRSLSHVDLVRHILYTVGVGVEDNAFCAVRAWAAFADTGATTCIQVQPGGQFDCAIHDGAAYVFGDAGCTGIALDVLPQGRVVYAHARPFVFSGASTDVQLGNHSVQFSELPYTNPIDLASVVEDASPNDIEDQYAALAADVTVLAINVATLATLNFTVNGLRQCQFWASWAVQVSGGAANSFLGLEIDGVQVLGAQLGLAGVASTVPGAFHYFAQLAAGAHTVRIRCHTLGGRADCRPATNPNEEHCAVGAKELYG